MSKTTTSSAQPEKKASEPTKGEEKKTATAANEATPAASAKDIEAIHGSLGTIAETLKTITKGQTDVLNRVEALEKKDMDADTRAAKTVAEAGVEKPLGEDPGDNATADADPANKDWGKATATELRNHFAALDDKTAKANFYIKHMRDRRDI